MKRAERFSEGPSRSSDEYHKLKEVLPHIFFVICRHGHSQSWHILSDAACFLTLNGTWVEYPTILPLGGRLPYLTPTGKNKTLKGDISCDIDVPPQSLQDTFRLDVFIYDRALHQSNTVTTSAIILNSQ